jgi:hypothetical protein
VQCPDEVIPLTVTFSDAAAIVANDAEATGLWFPFHNRRSLESLANDTSPSFALFLHFMESPAASRIIPSDAKLALGLMTIDCTVLKMPPPPFVMIQAFKLFA